MNNEEIIKLKQIRSLLSTLLPSETSNAVTTFESTSMGVRDIEINDNGADINVIKFYRGKILQSKNVVVVDLDTHVPTITIRNAYNNSVAFTMLCDLMKPGSEIRSGQVKEYLTDVKHDFSNSDIAVIVRYYNAWYEWHNIHDLIIYEIDTNL